MLQVFETIHKVSRTDATVLVTGETGTGKELVAEAIHYRSGRREKTYNPVNCAALTETLINSELFGHEKGAFTGAIGQRKGHFELADGGTIFLDEIGDIPIQTQIALLRVLELGTFYRVGGTQPIQVDTRLICATNHDLSLAIREKRFREDLYYRINVVSIRVPPLRERKSDIPLLAYYFLKKFADESKKKIDRISNACMRMFTEYHWPGNVRALANVIERATVFCSGREITPSHIPDEIRSPDGRGEITLSLPSRSLHAAEALLIRKVLEETNWNLKQAASALEVARATLYSKMKKHGIVKAGA
jgi:two-component system NtrC family response regulator/two-component system response regulator HydG